MALDKKQPVTSDEALAQEVLKKYDRESDTMQYTGFMAKIISAIAISFSVYYNAYKTICTSFRFKLSASIPLREYSSGH